MNRSMDLMGNHSVELLYIVKSSKVFGWRSFKNMVRSLLQSVVKASLHRRAQAQAARVDGGDCV